MEKDNEIKYNEIMSIEGRIDRKGFFEKKSLDEFIKRYNLFNLPIEEGDGYFFVSCINISISFNEKKFEFYFSVDDFKNLYQRSREDKPIKKTISKKENGEDVEEIENKEVIKIDKFKEKISGCLSVIVDIPKKIEIISNFEYLLDFEWEDLYSSVRVKRVKLSERYRPDNFNFDINYALFLISRASDNRNKKLTEGLNEELLNFQIGLTKTNRFFPIQHLAIRYFNDDCVIEEREWFIVNILGHGSEDGEYLCECKDTETDCTKAGKKTRDDFLSLFKKNKIKILNLSFCYSGRNTSSDRGSLPCILIDEGIVEYVIATKYSVGNNYMARFNNSFYNILFDKLPCGSRPLSFIEDCFFLAKESIEKDYIESYNNGEYYHKDNLVIFCAR